MRIIRQIVIHCAATKANVNVGVKEIRKWHMDRGWSDIGYHYVIRRDGTIEEGRPEEQIGAGVKGFNKHTIHICLVGGLDDDMQPENNFTDKQLLAAKQLARGLVHKYETLTSIRPAVVGHRDFPGVKKACPCFDVVPWFYEMIPDLDEENT
jgi:N-acetylmuramoyl-L-alanine amidase